MPLSAAQETALQGLMDRGYKSMSGHITPILNSLEHLDIDKFNEYVTYLPAYSISGVTSSSTASSSTASSSAAADDEIPPSIIIHHSSKTNKKDLTYLKSGASGAIFKNSGSSKNIAITSGNIWKSVTINSAEDIRDMFMEAFALAILGADDDPLISGSICRILGFYRPASVKKTYGSSSSGTNYGYQLVIKMSPYRTIDQHIKTVGKTFENYRIIINKTSNILLKLRDKYSFIHCDLHVGNVMFTEDGSPVLIDFGWVGLTIGSTRYATSEYARMGFSFDMLLYVISLYCDARQFSAEFRQILNYNGEDLFKFFIKNPTYKFPYEWHGPYNFILGDIMTAPNVLYKHDEIVDGRRTPRPTEIEMTNNIASINKASKTTWECIGDLCRPVTKFFLRSRKNRRNHRGKTRRVRKHRRS
jgi:hypothetical protein